MYTQPHTVTNIANWFTDRRGSDRVQIDAPASLRMLDPVGPERIEVRVRDVSTRGCKIHAPHFIQRGILVQIRFADAIAEGEVRYCVPAKTGFYAGVELRDVVTIPRVIA